LLAGGAGLVAAAAVVPFAVGAKLPVFIAMAGLLFVFLSLSLLVWTSGQISLCHAVFVALGATTMSRLTVDGGVPWLVALLLAGCATVPLGAIVAVPALRLSGVYLALATFGFGVVMQRVVFTTVFMFGNSGYRAAPRFALGPLDGANDRTFYLVVVGLALLAALGVLAVHSSRLGLFLRALGDSPTSLTSHGLSVLTTRLVVFCLSAFLAGIAGAVMVSSTGQVSADAFGPFTSLLWLAVLAMSGTRRVISPVVAAVLLAVAPSYLPSGFSDYQTMLFGATAVAASLLIDRRITLGGHRSAERLQRGPVPSRLAERPHPEAVAAV
jgi:ABC-type branched-subunit amino acid transport system permease subunit